MHSTSNAATLERAVPAHALWNPSVAACWSIIFTPAFGAFLLMRNWEALGDERQARQARVWFCFGLGLLGVRLFTAALNARLHNESNFIHWAGLIYLFGWWLFEAMPQARLVHAKYGPDYPRQGWDGALLLAVTGGFGYLLSSALLGWLLVALT
jgi:predicted membrane channel-forming protein YqfA (hemolysin III family)